MLALFAWHLIVGLVRSAHGQSSDEPPTDTPPAASDSESAAAADTEEPAQDTREPSAPPGTHATHDAPGADASSPADARGSEPATAEVEDETVVEDDESAGSLYTRGNGTYQVRASHLGEIPLRPLPREPSSGSLRQRNWVSQWIRLRAEGGLQDRFTVHAEIDLFDGLLVGELARGVEAARGSRHDATAFPGVQPRALYVDWRTPVGLVRAGLTTSHWGLGILANDGAHEPPFGDYELGDSVLRLAFATMPLGRRVPFFAALAGDLVYDDVVASLPDGDVALQGALAAYWQRDEHTVGAYAVARDQRRAIESGGAPFDETLRIVATDVFARWTFEEPTGGRWLLAAEGALVLGSTTATRSLEHARHRVRQAMGVLQLGRVHDRVDVIFELGYASGDSNALDEVQGRASMDPARRVGLVLFPEVLAWQSARSATIAQSDLLAARDAPGADRLPTHGGVAGAVYLFPHAIVRIGRAVDVRFGAVWARTAADHVDPYAQRAHSSNENPLGGDPRARDLGLELDGAVRWRGKLSRHVRLEAGLDAGLLLPGHAFDDASGETMDPVGLVRLRLGASF
ncbi:MAG: hypothetical protein RMK74_11845 [Myxococcales bacterium]|nr:hypothetical protein [Myxococcales bacterium]